MKVLFVDHTAKIGGGEIALANLVRQLNPTLVQSAVVLFEKGPLEERIQPFTNLHIVPISSSVSDTKKDGLGLKSIFQLKILFLCIRHIFKVAKLAKDLQIDVIHTNSLKADIIGGLAGRWAGIPVVWHIRDRIDVDYLSKPVVKLFRLLSRLIPTFVIANSKATLATIQLQGRRPSMAIGSGVDLEKYQLQNVTHDPDVSDGSPVIGLVGRISRWKGQHIFLAAAAEILKRYPTAQFQLIGGALFDEKDYEKELHALCGTLQIEKSVVFAGFVTDVPARVARLDILVHASITGEPYGQVIIEGMAAEKPVVATDGGGVPEIVVDGVTGLLVPMGDPVRMAEAIEHLLDNPQLRRSMGRLGRERAVEHFTIQKTARLVEAVYSQVVSPA